MSEPPTIKPSRRISKISHILSRSGLRLDRRFGQNFLVNQGALESIVAASGAGPRSAVVEIGAGLGNLTELLGRAAGHVVAVELDRNFQPIHQQYLADAKNIGFAYGDFLELPLSDLMPSGDWDDRIVVGNIPYNITSRILIKLLDETESFDRAYILMQREVADRLTAKSGCKRYSVLTAKMRCGFDTATKLRLTGRSFLPPPKVDSALVELIPLETPLLDNTVERKEFFTMLDGAFSMRRKTLPNGLSRSSAGQWPRDSIVEILNEIRIDPKTRPEGLDSSQLLAVFRALRPRLGPATFAGTRS